jgi:hypothetical protein
VRGADRDSKWLSTGHGNAGFAANRRRIKLRNPLAHGPHHAIPAGYDHRQMTDNDNQKGECLGDQLTVARR